MKKLVIALNILLLSVANYAQQIDGPESIVFDPINNRYLVSSLNNGDIIEIDMHNKHAVIQSLGTAVLGNCINGSSFYVSTPTKIVAMNLITDEIDREILISGAMQLDGMTVTSNNMLFVVDGTINKMFRVDLANDSVVEFAQGEEFEMAQDLYFDETSEKILMCPFRANAPIYSIDPITSAIDTLIETSIGYFDGISMDNNRNLFVSNFQEGEVWMYDSTFSNSPTLIKSNISGASGLDFNKSLNVLAIPAFNEDKIYFLEMDFSHISFEENLVSLFSTPAGIHIGDIDGDGFKDIVSASSGNAGVSWFKNDGAGQNNWDEYEIDPNLANALFVYTGFINDDSLLDVVAASWGQNEISWYENNGGTTISWTKHHVSTSFDGAHEVMLFDVDQNGTLDILGAGADINQITVWYNHGQDSISWVEEIIDQNAAGARSVSAEDIDMDGDIDIVSASLVSNELTWYKKNNNEWEEITIDNNYKLSHRVFLTDMDNDGDIDILGSGYTETNIYWWENITTNETHWLKHKIEDNFNGQVLAHAVDFNGDGQKDIVATSQGLHDIKWYRNDFYNGREDWEHYNLNLNFAGVWPLYCDDLDNDGDQDIVAGGNNANRISFWRNSLYQTTTHPPKAIISKSETTSCVGANIIFNSMSTGTIDNYIWNFGEDANIANATGEGPHEISYSTYGLKEIKLIVEGSSGNDSCSTIIFIDTAISFAISPQNPTICGSTPTLMLARNLDSAQWIPNLYLDNPNSNIVICSPQESITYTVTGYKGNYSYQVEQMITIESIEYDKIENAKNLFFGMNLNLTNNCATVETNEPHPPLTGCTGQHSWCPEGGLQNSVWFKFEAPESGRVKINTTGFDNQIALYDADSHQDILNGNYEILYANDDFNPDASAQITDAQGLTPGKTYWVQVDGSNGGQTGSFHLNLLELVNIDEQKDNTCFNIYPNPNEGNFQIEFGDAIHSGNIEIVNVIGQVIYAKDIQEEKTLKLNLSAYPTGIYYCNYSNKSLSISKKIVVN